MKKFLPILMALAVSTVLLSACATVPTTSSTLEKTSSVADTPSETNSSLPSSEEQTITGVISNLSVRTSTDVATGSMMEKALTNLKIRTADGAEFSFSLEGTEIVDEKELETSHAVTLTYTGTIDGQNTDNVTVKKVVPEKEQSLSGTIEDAAMNSLVLKTDEGKSLSFSTLIADKTGVDGLEIGKKITVYYIGQISDTNTDNVIVTKLTK